MASCAGRVRAPPPGDRAGRTGRRGAGEQLERCVQHEGIGRRLLWDRDDVRHGRREATIRPPSLDSEAHERTLKAQLRFKSRVC